MLKTFLELLVPLLVLASLVRTLVSKGVLRTSVRSYRQLRPRHFGWALVAVLATFASIALLVSVPGLQWGWWTLLGGHGSIIAGSSAATGGHAGAHHHALSHLLALLPVVLVTVVLALIPVLAASEESSPSIGRVGSENRTLAQRVTTAVKFGLAHLVMGIPLGAALGLSVGGAFFTGAYLRAYRRAEASAVVELWRARSWVLTHEESREQHPPLAQLLMGDPSSPDGRSIWVDVEALDQALTTTPVGSDQLLDEIRSQARRRGGALVATAAEAAHGDVLEDVRLDVLADLAPGPVRASVRASARAIALNEATMVHTAYNVVVFALVLATLVVAL